MTELTIKGDIEVLRPLPEDTIIVTFQTDYPLSMEEAHRISQKMQEVTGHDRVLVFTIPATVQIARPGEEETNDD